MANSILYLGDTHLRDAAAYLAGLLHHWSWDFDYVPSDEPATAAMFDAPRALVIVSDYPAARMDAVAQRKLIEQVVGGAGLIMIGGWESFHGLGGNWDGTPVGDAQPVMIAAACNGGEFHFAPLDRHPLLVVGEFGCGRTAALATDVAPHWVGPLVDWGVPRVAAQAPQANAVEVGGNYATFLRQLLSWIGRL